MKGIGQMAVIDQGMSPEGSLVKVTPVLLPQQQKSQGQGLCTGKYNGRIAIG